MRVRITRARTDEVDGVALDALRVGSIYDVSSYLGTYLVTTGSAESVDAREPALVLPLSEVRIEATVNRLRAVAADMGCRRDMSLSSGSRIDSHEPEKG